MTDASPAFLALRMALRLVTDWTTLEALAADIIEWDDIADGERDALMRYAEAREIELKPGWGRIA